MKIVVVGGTGLIGSKLVEKLRLQGHDVLGAAPNTGVDTLTGYGLDDALNGAEIVVDVSNSPSIEDRAAMDFFTVSSRNIVAAEQKARVRHHLALSVIGTERLQESGYFRAKLAQERTIKQSSVPYTLIHAAQFFEFLRAIAQTSTVDGAVRLAPVEFQPMASEDVAAALAKMAVGAPLNRTVEIAGPEVFTIDQAVRKVLQFDRDPRPVLTDPSVPYYGAKVSGMMLMPGSDALLGTTRLDWWITHVPAPAKKVADESRIIIPAH